MHFEEAFVDTVATSRTQAHLTAEVCPVLCLDFLDEMNFDEANSGVFH
jgi:hypothetical protein